jgi:endonuclease YncB( thermonuclease family)
MNRHAFLLILLFVSPACAEGYPARVVGVSDGDTLTVLTAEKRQVKIRLAGIELPNRARISVRGPSRRRQSWRSGRP